MVFSGMLIMSVGWTYRFLLLIGWPLISTNVILAAMVPVMLLEFLYLSKPLRTFEALRTLRFFPLFQLYFLLCVIFIPFVAFFSKDVVWKERTHAQ